VVDFPAYPKSQARAVYRTRLLRLKRSLFGRNLNDGFHVSHLFITQMALDLMSIAQLPNRRHLGLA
jgi:hypothetical protein